MENSEVSYYRGCPANSLVTAPTELTSVGFNAFNQYKNVLYYVLLHALDANTRDSAAPIIT